MDGQCPSGEYHVLRAGRGRLLYLGERFGENFLIEIFLSNNVLVQLISIILLVKRCIIMEETYLSTTETALDKWCGSSAVHGGIMNLFLI